MSIASKFCKQKAVYFAPGDKDKFSNRTFAAGVEVKCRWEEGEEEVIVSSGDAGEAVKFVARHRVLVDRDVERGGLLWLGTLAEWEALGLTSVKASTANHHQIATYRKTPTVRAKDFLREVWM